MRQALKKKLIDIYRYRFRNFRTPLNIPDPLARPYYRCDSKKFLFPSIPKNGCTTVKTLIQELDWEEKYDGDIHRFPGWKEEQGRVLTLEQTKNKTFNDYVKFAIYRDPVARFLSCYQNKIVDCIDTPPFYLHYGMTGASLDRFIDFVEWYFKKPWGACEAHIAPQSKFYRLEDLTYLVDIKYLDQFMKNKFDVALDRSKNSSNSKKNSLTAHQERRIRRLYAPDFLLEPNYP